MEQPALDDVVLRAGPHAGPQEHLLRRVPGLVHAVEAAEAQPDHAAVLLQGEVAAVLDHRVLGQLPGILADLVEHHGLVSVKEGKLLSYLVYPAVLVSRQALLVLELVDLEVALVVGDLMAGALLRVAWDCGFHAERLDVTVYFD